MFDELKQYDDVIKIFASSPLQKDCKFLRIKNSVPGRQEAVVFFARRNSLPRRHFMLT